MGLRYGKFMWNVELALYTIFAEQAATRAACTPRPRLSSERPPVSFVNPINVMTVLAQFVVHACTRAAGVRVAFRSKLAFLQPKQNRRLVRAAPIDLSNVSAEYSMHT